MIASVFLLTVITAVLLDQSYGVIRRLVIRRPDGMTIVIDAGHGGFDPGKVGINHVLEKDINLSVAYKVKKLLELENIKVVMTRKDENGLYKKSDGDKKRIDMNNRIKIINGSEAAFAISIHQNSFSQETSHGAQVFYYEGSEKGQELAETLQETIKKSMMDGNHRLARPNSSYFLLRYSNCPLVIVECGFLTNRREAALLAEDSYQDKIAWAIYLGVMEYIKAYLKENNFADELPAS
jgi:N-acetylmuramoyl-L-alanine amidase